jgi:hypothetical protein
VSVVGVEREEKRAGLTRFEARRAKLSGLIFSLSMN